MYKEAFKMVFSYKKYLGLSITIFVGLLIGLSIVSEFIFFSPIFVFHVPTNSIFNFTLIVIIAALSGIVTSLSIYRIRMLGNGIRKSGTGFFGSIIGASTGACSCGSFGFAAVSTLGIVGGTATLAIFAQQDHLELQAGKKGQDACWFQFYLQAPSQQQQMSLQDEIFQKERGPQFQVLLPIILFQLQTG